jgi:endonuclease/exonuclease/phosphatase family metal-dependent hydrolase
VTPSAAPSPSRARPCSAGHCFDAVTNPDAAKAVPATYRDSLDYVGSPRRAEVGPVQLVHYDGGTIPSDHYPVLAEIHY